MGGAPNLLATVPLAWQHRADLLGRDSRRKIERLVKLARRQGGLRCANGYVVACCYCGFWMPLALATIEHLVNRRDGGTNRWMNMALACYRCNNKRNAREAAMERRYGLRKFVRRRLHLFRMDAGAQELIRVVVVGDRLKLKPVRLTGEGAQR